MKCLFLGSFCSEEEEKFLLSVSKTGLQSSIISFQRNVLKGLLYNLLYSDSLEIVNFFPIGTWPYHCSKLYIRSEREGNYYRMALLNIPIIKQLFYNLQTTTYITRWVRKNKNEIKFILMYDTLRPYLKVLSEMSFDPNSIRCTIVADLLNEYGYKKHEKGLKGWIKKRVGYDSMSRIRKLDIVGLLTRQMSVPLQIPDDKYIVIEGFSNSQRFFTPLEINNHIILYSGVLSTEYQIDVLLDAFELISNKEYELWLCGSGPFTSEIINRTKSDSRIKYWGHKIQAEVALLQSKATVLINPRQNVGEYTKYSFPSKIIEYLSSARPVIAYKLEGINQDYYDYIFTPQDNSITTLRDILIEVLEMPVVLLRDLGIRGRKFVLERTSPTEQISKLLKLGFSD